MSDALIRVEQLSKTFGTFDAVNGVSFDVARRRDLRVPGSQRRRQDHDHPDAHHAAPPDGGHDADRRPGSDESIRTDVRQRFGIVFQDPSLDGELTAYENMELHGVLYHVPRRLRHERTEQLLTLVRAVGPPGRPT